MCTRFASKQPAAIKTVLGQLCRYCTVALLGLGLHLGLITLFVEVAGLHYTLAFISALPITFTSKFAADRCWTFKVKPPLLLSSTDALEGGDLPPPVTTLFQPLEKS